MPADASIGWITRVKSASSPSSSTASRQDLQRAFDRPDRDAECARLLDDGAEVLDRQAGRPAALERSREDRGRQHRRRREVAAGARVDGGEQGVGVEAIAVSASAHGAVDERDTVAERRGHLAQRRRAERRRLHEHADRVAARDLGRPPTLASRLGRQAKTTAAPEVAQADEPDALHAGQSRAFRRPAPRAAACGRG